VKLKLSLLLVAICTFTMSCADWYYEEEGLDTYGVIERVLENEILQPETFVTTVQEGDVLYFRVRGRKYKNVFSAVYKKMVISTWDVRDCTRGCSALCVIMGSCRWAQRKGTCDLFYRRHIIQRERPIRFSNNIKEIPLKVKIGDVRHPVGESFKIRDDILYATFNVSQQMLKTSDQLFLIIPKEKKKKIRVGFQRYGSSCDGFGKRNFRVSGTLKSHLMDAGSNSEFEASVSIARQYD